MTDYRQFIARACHQEACRLLRKAAAPPEEATSTDESPDQHTEDAVLPLRGCLVRFHHECAARDRGTPGLKVNTPAYWQMVKDEWDGLAEDERQHFREAHEAQLQLEVDQARVSKFKEVEAPTSGADSVVNDGNMVLCIRGKGDNAAPVTDITVHNVGGQRPVLDHDLEGRRRRGMDSGKLVMPPMLPQVLRDKLGKLPCRTAAMKFDEKYGHRVATDKGAVPLRVRWHRPCMGVCTQDPSQYAIARGRVCNGLETHLRGYYMELVAMPLPAPSQTQCCP